MKIKGVFTSVWDDDVEIVTKAILDKETGEVTAETAEVENLDILQREFFTSEEFANAGEEYEICPECHTFILKVVMKDGIGHTYEEVNVCSDPDCENQ